MDLTGYKLVFEDDFDGDKLDLDKWYHYGLGPRRGGFIDEKSVRVDNGNLIIRHEYRDGPNGEQWYAGMIATREKFCRGYFEARCICSETIGDCQNTPMSAYWLCRPGVMSPEISLGGPGGAEVDIFESNLDLMDFNKNSLPGIVTNIHLAGRKGGKPEGHESKYVGGVTIPDVYTAYHTYAFEWTEEEYRFYVDGLCYGVSSWADGVSEVPEEIIFSLEPPVKCDYPKDFTCEFKVDYLRIYQKD